MFFISIFGRSKHTSLVRVSVGLVFCPPPPSVFRASEEPDPASLPRTEMGHTQAHVSKRLEDE